MYVKKVIVIRQKPGKSIFAKQYIYWNKAIRSYNKTLYQIVSAFLKKKTISTIITFG